MTGPDLCHPDIRNDMTPPPAIEGADLLTQHFGYWPSFHDAEVISIHLDRNGPTADIVIHTWEMTDQVDDAGFFVLDKHCLVHLRCEKTTGLTLDGFNHQNVLFGLTLSKKSQHMEEPSNWKLALESTYGLDGSISAGSFEIVSVMSCDHRGLMCHNE